MPKNFKHRPLFAQSLPKEVAKPKIEWKILPVLWGALKRTAMVLGFFVLLQVFVVLFIVLPAAVANKGPDFPDEMVLYLELDGGFDEVYVAQGFADAFDEPPLSLREAIDVLHEAAGDERVKGLVARMKPGPIGLVQAHELGQALSAFKASGKFARIYSSSYGEAGGGLGSYTLVSQFDEIWMQPMGIVTIMGLHAEMPFMRKTLDKVGVTPNFFQRKEYKTAYENLTNSKMSKENRETITRLIGDIRDDILTVVPARVGMDRAQFNALVNKGLFTAEEAKTMGLITHSDYADVLVANIKEEITGDRESDDELFISFDTYAADVLENQKHSKKAPKVALVYAVGAIMQSADGGGIPGAGSGVAAAEEIAPAILDAADDEEIEAIVVRVDSPGGSPVASESILRAIQRAQAKGKTVIVSMGATAASGGYWISASADQIFVLPTTITGSIGVVGGKFALADLFKKIGVNWDGVRWGKNSGMWSMNSEFSKSEAERINAMLDAVYDGFIARVADGRKMTPEAVDKIAGGRVWSGKRAVEIGLADQFGGLNDALDYTAKQLGAENREGLEVVVMPEPKTALEQFVELIEGQAMLGQAVRQNSAVLEWLRPVNDAAAVAQNPNDFMVMERFKLR